MTGRCRYERQKTISIFVTACHDDGCDFVCAMNVFNFDVTIYDGDSSIDFWLFCLNRKPALFSYFPKQIFGVILYKLKKLQKKSLNAVISVFSLVFQT